MRISLSLAIAVAASVALTGQAQTLVEQGDQALRNGDLAGAHSAYGNAVSASPQDADANLMRAVTLLGDLFDNPTAGIEAVLEGWDADYLRDIYAIVENQVLLVRDHNGYGGDWRVDDWATDKWNIEDWDVPWEGVPSLSTLQGYQAVIWDMGDTNGGASLDILREQVIGQFLAQGGKLFLAGDNVLNSATETFRATYLKIDTVSLDVGAAGEPMHAASAEDAVGGGMTAVRVEEPAGSDAFTLGTGAVPLLLSPSDQVRASRVTQGASQLVFLASAPGHLLLRPWEVTEQRYQVWGRDTQPYDVYWPEFNGFAYLGEGTTTADFQGAYSYFLILATDSNACRLDTVQGIDEAGLPADYYGTTHTGNTLDHGNIGGAPDGAYGVLNTNNWRGGIVIDASADALTGVRIICVDETAWPWDDPNNVSSLVERVLEWFDVPIVQSIPEERPVDAMGVNDTVDNLRSGLSGRLDEMLDRLEAIGAADAGWSRTVTADMLPGFDPTDDDNDSTTLGKTDVLFLQAGLNLIKFGLDVVAGYDFDVDYQEVEDEIWTTRYAGEPSPEESYWDSDAQDFFTVRSNDAMQAAKGSLRNALAKTLAGLDLMQSTDVKGKDRVGLAAEVREVELTQVRDVVSQLLAAVDGDTDLTVPDIDPIMLNLGKLFDSPTDRTVLDPYDFDLGEFAWDELPDPTLGSAFPGKTMAQWYRYMTIIEDSTMPFVTIQTDAQGGQFFWNSVYEWGDRWDPDAQNWYWGERWALDNDFMFADKMQFNVYRGYEDARAETLLTPTPLAAADFRYPEWDGAPWQIEDEGATLQSNLYYRVEFTFSDGTNTATWSSPRAYLDSDGDGMPDYWESQHGLNSTDSDDVWDDPDNDGLGNEEEYEAGTDPNDPDSDGDGISDGYEEEHSLDATDPGDANGDYDLDGYSNLVEYRYGTDAAYFDSNPAMSSARLPISVRDDWEWANADAALPMVDEASEKVVQSCLGDGGRRVFFTSQATNLDARVDGTRLNIFVRDVRTGTTEALCVGQDARAATFSNAMMQERFLGASADGHIVFFASDSTNLVPGLGGAPGDVSRLYCRDLDAETTVLVSELEMFVGGSDLQLKVTPDGHFAAFRMVVSDDPVRQSHYQVFRYDVDSDTLVQTSVSPTGVPANGECYLGSGDPTMAGADVRQSSALSEDGRFVLFTTQADNLVPDDTNMMSDIFRRDFDTGGTIRINLAADGAESAGGAAMGDAFVAASGDGQVVLFRSGNATLAGDQYDGDPMSFGTGLFLRDVGAGETVLVDQYMEAAMERYALLSADGRFVAYEKDEVIVALPPPFGSVSQTLIYLYDRLTGETVLATPPATQSYEFPSGNCRFAAVSDAGMTERAKLRTCFSRDGRFLFFQSAADNLVPNDMNGMADIFVRDLLHGATRIVNLSNDGDQSSGNPMMQEADTFARASNDGRYVSFTSFDQLTDDAELDWYAVTPSLFTRDLVLNTTMLTLDFSEYGDPMMVGGFSHHSGRFGLVSAPEEVTDTRIQRRRVYLIGQLDTDWDGMTDHYEWWFGLDPHDPADAAEDYDGDNLTCLEEFRAHTDPYLEDTDGDALPDDWEVAEGIDPLLDDADSNPDGDALTNLEEFTAGTHPRIRESIDFLVLYQGWNLVSIPSGVTNATVASVFGDQIFGNAWAWDGINQVYVDAADHEPLSDKRGYWVYSFDDTVIHFEVGR